MPGVQRSGPVLQCKSAQLTPPPPAMPPITPTGEIVSQDANRRDKCDANRDGDVSDDVSSVHKSSRMPLKTGWRTLPSADFARYSISARISGSTQMPLYAIRLV